MIYIIYICIANTYNEDICQKKNIYKDLFINIFHTIQASAGE